MGREDLKKIYQDSVRTRRIKLNKMERALEGVNFKNINDKQYDYVIELINRKQTEQKSFEKE